MLKRLRRWWLRRHAPSPMASEHMQALIEINLLEIQLSALEALNPSTPATEATKLRARVCLSLVPCLDESKTPAWSELWTAARALNRELAAVLAAAQIDAPSEA